MSVPWYCSLACVAAMAVDVAAAPPRIAGVKHVPRAIMSLELDYVADIQARDAAIRPGVVVDVQLLSGKQYTGMEIAEIKAGPKPNTFRTLTFKPSMKGQPTKLAPTTLAQLRTPEGKYDVVSDPSAKAWQLLDLNQRDAVATQRLQIDGESLWESPTDEELQAAWKFYDELMAKAQAEFPQLRFQRIETQYFVFYTDMPAPQVAGYIANLDKMYDQLCLLFGVPTGTNIWVGKCPVIAFAHNEAFMQFEARHMDNFDTQGVAGLNHQWSDGRVVTTCARGDDPVFFAVILVHETAHGFVHRMRSTKHIPVWMNEGLAEWISAVVVPQSDHIASRLSEALPRIQSTASLGGNFLDERGRIDRWQYGVAATLTQMMLTSDANAYRALITGIKEGYPWEEALRLTYGITPVELAAAYGRQVGIPMLRP